MKLKKSVCKACRKQAFGKKGWNEFAEAWFNLKEGVTYCPFTITDKMKARIKKDVAAMTSKYPKSIKDAMNDGYVIIEIHNINTPRWCVKCSRPPSWCPFIKYHSMSGNTKLPVKVTRYELK